MSKLHITEFSSLAKAENGSYMPIPLATETGGFSQVVSIGATSTQSSMFNSKTVFIRVLSDVNCYIAYGKDPKATNSSYRLLANKPEIIGIQVGRSMKIAVMQ